MASRSSRGDGPGPEPPKVLAIVIACIVGVVLLAGGLALVNLLH